MWFIFPQLEGLAYSARSRLYAIQNLTKASDYLDHPILGKRLIEISTVLLGLQNGNVTEIMGSLTLSCIPA